jgi:Flp pilus assembly pilin Flp
MGRLESLLRRDEGEDVVEYGLLAAFISIAALLTIKVIGPAVNGLYEQVKNAFSP